MEDSVSKSFKRAMNTVFNKEKGSPTQRPEKQSSMIVHKGTLCDNCGISPIIGSRFSCVICQNYDLCDQCENFS